MKAMQLYSKNFKNGKIDFKKPGILLVRADWCGHCVSFMPEYEKLAKIFMNENLSQTDFMITHIESSDISHKNVIEAIGEVRQYPTILFFDKTGKIKGEYTKERSIEAMIKYICKYYKAHCVKI